jgi:pantoate--beta-alanine ligase
MGALHAGHLALAERAVAVADHVVVSIFVNPLQFGKGEDLEKYPRTIAEDIAKLGEARVGFVFAPTVEEMYPHGEPQTKVTAGKVGELFEGRSRPGHFDGVLTVVAKLLHIVDPDVVVFGEKDAQQVFLVERMIRDLSFRASIATVPTVREDTGLALSSRNRFLDEGQRRAARVISQALEAARGSSDAGVNAALAAAQSVLVGEKLVELDYLAIVDPASFLPVSDDRRGPAQVLIAAKVGSTRLIDNAAMRIG